MSEGPSPSTVAVPAMPVHDRPMAALRFDRVTEPQRECLRLVLTRRNSKEIALALGISSHTVDKRLGRAGATLGVSNRFDAARLLAEHEGTPMPPAAETYETLVYQSPDVPPAADPVKLTATEALTADPGDQVAPAIWLPVRPQGGRVNPLSIRQRLLWIMTIPAALAVAVGMLGFGLSVIGKLFQVLRAVAS